MSLRNKLILGFGGLLLILLLVSGLSILFLTRYSHSLQRMFRENYDSVVFCDRMGRDAESLSADAERQLWTGQAPDAARQAERIADFEANLGRQQRNVSLVGERELTDTIAEQWKQFRSALESFGAAPKGPSQQTLFRDRLLPLGQRISQASQATADLNMSNMVSVDGQVTGTLRSVRKLMAVFAAAGTALAIILLAAVGATILTPLRLLTDSAHQIAGGDLETQVPVRTRDEVGQLAIAFNTMAARLREFRRIDHERLQRVQATTQLAIDSLHDAVFVVGPKGVVEISNTTAAKLFSIVPGAAIADLGLPWLQELHQHVCSTAAPWDPQEYRSAIQLFEASQERFLLPRAVPMFNDAKHLIGVTVILVDVTRLRHADELKSGLVSTVSHELRTPLTSIRMAVMMLADEKFGPLPKVQKKLVLAAREDADRLYRIIENLLSMSRIASGGQKFVFRRMSPGEIVELAADPLAARFTAKGIGLRVDCDASMPSVEADPDCIGYALSNLLSNALKYSSAGSEVELRVHCENEKVVFSVLDRGPGVPEEFRQKVFEKFFRLARKEGPGGAGLGLAVAKEIVEAHHGQIGCDGREGGGSAFWFWLPAATS